MTFPIRITGLEIKNHFKKFLDFLRKFQPIEDKNISKTDEGMIKFSYFYAYELDENKRIKIHIICNKSFINNP